MCYFFKIKVTVNLLMSQFLFNEQNLIESIILLRHDILLYNAMTFMFYVCPNTQIKINCIVNKTRCTMPAMFEFHVFKSCWDMKIQHVGQHKIFWWRQTTFQSTYFHPSFLNKFSSLYVRPLTPCHHSFLFTLKSIKAKFLKCKFVIFTCVCRL